MRRWLKNKDRMVPCFSPNSTKVVRNSYCCSQMIVGYCT